MNVMNSETQTDVLDLPYQVILDLDDEGYSSQAQDLVRLFKNDVDNDGNLDFGKVLTTTKAQPNLAIIGTINSRYKQSRKALVALVEGIADTVARAGALNVSGENSEFNDSLTKVFGNLKEQEGKPWFNISSDAGGRTGGTVYTYNLFYISHSLSTGGLLSATLLSFRVSIDASIKDLLGYDDEDKVDIKYEKYQVATEIKGLSLIKPVD